MREIAGSGPIAGRPGDSTQEERYARELAASMGGALPERPRFVFGGAGLALGEMAVEGEAKTPEGVCWRIGDTAGWPGYDAALVEDVIAAVRTDLDTFDEGEQAVLENHGYLLADAALRERGLAPADAANAPVPEVDGRGEGAGGAGRKLAPHPAGRLRHRRGTPSLPAPRVTARRAGA